LWKVEDYFLYQLQSFARAAASELHKILFKSYYSNLAEGERGTFPTERELMDLMHRGTIS
jgi:hypothetical protein